jgi:hypothetical protein
MGKFAINLACHFAFYRGIGVRGKGHDSGAHGDTSLIDNLILV